MYSIAGASPRQLARTAGALYLANIVFGAFATGLVRRKTIWESEMLNENLQNSVGPYPSSAGTAVIWSRAVFSSALCPALLTGLSFC